MKMSYDVRPTRVTEPEESAMVVEENVYTDVYRVLLAGMLVSSALFALGIIEALLHPRLIPLSRHWILDHYHFGVVFSGLTHLRPTALMLVATALLILTPVARVLVSIYAFAVDRDRKYMVVTGIVFLIMTLTVILGMLGLK